MSLFALESPELLDAVDELAPLDLARDAQAIAMPIPIATNPMRMKSPLYQQLGNPPYHKA
jgi:hypothetical protein